MYSGADGLVCLSRSRASIAEAHTPNAATAVMARPQQPGQTKNAIDTFVQSLPA
jgi:hypothetical protein